MTRTTAHQRWVRWLMGWLTLTCTTVWAGPPPGLPPMPVPTLKIAPQTWQPTWQASGNVVAAEGVALKAATAGTVTSLPVTSGQWVQAGDPLVGVDEGLAANALNQARAKLRLADITLHRVRRLAAQHTASDMALDTATANAAALRAAARMAQLRYQHAHMTAPFAGRIGLTHVQVGDYVTPGEALMNLVNPHRLWVDFDLPQAALNRVHPNQPVTLTLDAQQGHTWKAKVLAVDPQLKVSSRSVACRAVVQGVSNQLTPGAFVHVTLHEPQRSILAVPTTALMTGPHGPYVWLAKGHRAQPQPIHLGDVRDGRAVIKQGLKPGDRVVLGHLQLLFPGSEIRPHDVDADHAFQP